MVQLGSMFGFRSLRVLSEFDAAIGRSLFQKKLAGKVLGARCFLEPPRLAGEVWLFGCSFAWNLHALFP